MGEQGEVFVEAVQQEEQAGEGDGEQQRVEPFFAENTLHDAWHQLHMPLGRLGTGPRGDSLLQR